MGEPCEDLADSGSRMRVADCAAFPAGEFGFDCCGEVGADVESVCEYVEGVGRATEGVGGCVSVFGQARAQCVGDLGVGDGAEDRYWCQGTESLRNMGMITVAKIWTK